MEENMAEEIFLSDYVSGDRKKLRMLGVVFYF